MIAVLYAVKTESTEAMSAATDWILSTIDRPRSFPGAESSVLAPAVSKLAPVVDKAPLIVFASFPYSHPSESDVRNLFKTCGIISCSVRKFENVCVASLEFSCSESVRLALKLNGSSFKGKTIKVETEKPLQLFIFAIGDIVMVSITSQPECRGEIVSINSQSSKPYHVCLIDAPSRPRLWLGESNLYKQRPETDARSVTSYSTRNSTVNDFTNYMMLT